MVGNLTVGATFHTETKPVTKQPLSKIRCLSQMFVNILKVKTDVGHCQQKFGMIFKVTLTVTITL